MIKSIRIERIWKKESRCRGVFDENEKKRQGKALDV